MTGKKIAVTGAFGFIGSYISTELISRGHSVLAIGRNQAGIKVEGAEVMEGDLFDLDFMNVLDWRPDVLIHLAGPAGVWKSWDDIRAETAHSVLLTAHMIEQWRKRPSMRFVFVSSAAVYGDHPEEPTYGEDLVHIPQSPYGVCKSASENLIRLMAQKKGLEYAIARPFSVYGPGLRKQVVYDLTRRFLRGEDPLEIKSTGQEERDFVHVRDCAAILASLSEMELPQDGLTVNIGTGKSVTLRELSALIARHSAHRGKVTFTGKDSPGNPRRLVADVSRLSALGLSCDISLEEGIAGMVTAIREEED